MKLPLLMILALTIVPALATVGSDVQLNNDESTISLDTQISGPGSFSSESFLNPESMSATGIGGTNGNRTSFESIIQMSGKEGFASTSSSLQAAQSLSTFTQNAIYSTGLDYFGMDYFIPEGNKIHSSLAAKGSGGIAISMFGFGTPDQVTRFSLDAETINSFQGNINFYF